MNEAPPSLDARDDETLLAAARGGDRAALEQLLLRHQGQIYRFGMKMCRDPEAARDVLQETLLAMARGVRDFRGASSLSTWLYTVARSFCIKQRRRDKRAGEAATLDGDAGDEVARRVDPSKSPDEALASKQVDQAVERAIRGLEPMYREVLILRDVEGLTAPEVAEVLGVSVQAVKSRLHRARVAVREAVAPMLGAPADEASPPSGCPDVVTMFSQHLEDEISAEVCARMQRHIDGCARCRGVCDSLERTLMLCRRVGPDADVPPDVQASVQRALAGLLRGIT